MTDRERHPLARSLDRALTNLLLEQLRVGAFLYAFALPGICFVLWMVIPWAYLLPWAAVLAATAIARYGIGVWAGGRALEPVDVAMLRRFSWGVLGVSSLAWGSAAGFILLTDSVAYQMFVGVVLAGVAAATVLSVTAAPTVSRMSVVLILGPLVAALPFANDTAYTFVPFIAVWAVVLFVLAQRLHNGQRKSLSLEIENVQLVDELRAQSASLERSEAYFRTLAERAEDLVLSLSANGAIEYCSQSVESLLGYQPSDVVGTHITDYLHPDDADAFEPALRNPRDIDVSGAPDGARPERHVVARFRDKDGDWRFIESSIRDLTADPIVAGIVVNARDITHRRQAEEKLTSANKRFDTAFHANPAMVAIASAESGELYSVNDKWTEILGFKREDVLGKTAVDLNIWVDPAERTRANEARAEDGSLKNFDVKFRTRNGGVIYGLHSSEPIEIDGQAMRLGITIDVTERKLAEEQLRRANDRFHIAFNSSPNLIGLTEIDSGVVVDVNQKWLETLGYRRDEIVGRVIDDLGVWDDIDERRALFDQVQRGGAARDLVTTFRRRDGTAVHALFGAVLTEVEDRRVLLWVGTDITERKEAQDALRLSEERFRNLVQGSVQGLVVIDQDWKPVFANDAAARIFGFDHGEELLALDSIEPGVHRDDLPRLKTYTKARFNEDSEVPPVYEYRGFRKDGAMIWLQVMVQVIDWEGQRCLQCTQIDISEQKSAQREALESDTRFRNLIEGSIEGIMIFRSNRLLFVNQALAEIFGYTTDELLNEIEIDELIDPAEHERLRLYRDERLHGEDVPQRYEFRGLRKDGSTAWLEISVRVVIWEGERAFQCAIVDRTARREAEDRLRQSQKLEAIGGLTGGIAHEFNNLLMVVTGNLELLRDGIDDETLRKWVNTALKGATRGSELTQRLLAFARRQPLRPQPTDVNELLDGVLQMSQKTLGAELEITFDAESEAWPTNIDRVQLETAFLNLLINARDAMPEGGRITVATDNVTLSSEEAAKLGSHVSAGDYVVVAVTDVGVGMAANVAEQAFEPFYTTKEVGKGTGLGLSMVYGFALQSRGAAQITSATGQGTTVRIYLPRDRSAPSVEVDPVLEDIDMHADLGGNVLVVDDDPDVLDTAAELIEALGCHVFRANSGEAALDILANGSRIDLLFTDIVMPRGISGWRLAEEARARYPDVKVLLASALGFDGGQGGVEGDKYAMVRKPYEKSELGRCVHEILSLQ